MLQTDRVQYRYINSDALSSLQIIEPEYHPSSRGDPMSDTSGSKEALSVYGLFHQFAHTPQGKQRLRQSFLRPTTDLNLINERLDFIGVFLRPENMDALSITVKSLKGIKNMHPVMINLRKGANGVRKNGGTNSGIWSTLRSVSIYGSQPSCLTELKIAVRVSCLADTRRLCGIDRGAGASSMVQGISAVS